jgi:hypothetical protein
VLIEFESLVGGFEMPVLPVNSICTIESHLVAFHRQLSTNGGAQKIPNPTQNVLPYCSSTHRLSEHAVNVLTDLTSTFRDMLDMIANPTGRAKIEKYLDQEADAAITFWQEEYLAE